MYKYILSLFQDNFQQCSCDECYTIPAQTFIYCTRSMLNNNHLYQHYCRLGGSFVVYNKNPEPNNYTLHLYIYPSLTLHYISVSYFHSLLFIFFFLYIYLTLKIFNCNIMDLYSLLLCAITESLMKTYSKIYLQIYTAISVYYTLALFQNVIVLRFILFTLPLNILINCMDLKFINISQHNQLIKQ